VGCVSLDLDGFPLATDFMKRLRADGDRFPMQGRRVSLDAGGVEIAEQVESGGGSAVAPR
jgi:hypothetical protein